MASYPTSIFAPASKNTGDVVQASHVNNLDAEVVAVETALKNGIAHNITISTGGLTVSTGVTTLGGTLGVAGNSTLAATHIGSSLTLAGSLRIPTQSTTVGGASTFVNDLVIADTAVMILIDNNSTAFAIGGISGGTHGRYLTIVNAGSEIITVVGSNVGSSAENRFSATHSLSTNGGSVSVVYSTATFGRLTPGWIVVST